MIKNISVEKLHPHPGNPRLELGDLTELADSIKARGVMQNLTVVQSDGENYMVIIGHRRLAASKIAGLTEVPCALVKMDSKEQIATMLLENIQRSDLTVYEQAQGFQMMMDLGETVNKISEKTGFSDTTVRRRIKLLDLDQRKLKESVDRGATLSDYAALEKIEDIGLRNKVLESIGTPNFEWNLRKAKDKEKSDKVITLVADQLDKFATRIEEREDKFVYIRHYNDTIVDEKVIKPEDADTRKYYYQIQNYQSYSSIILYAEIIEEDVEKSKEEERERTEEELKARLKEVENRAKDLREDFIESLTNSKVEKNIGDILLLGIEARTSFYMWPDDYIKTFKLDIDVENFELEMIKDDIKNNPELSMLKIIYNEDLKNKTYSNWRGEYLEDKELDMLYDLLKKLGYEMSGEEKQLKDGTHKLFKGIE